MDSRRLANRRMVVAVKRESDQLTFSLEDSGQPSTKCRFLSNDPGVDSGLAGHNASRICDRGCCRNHGDSLTLRVICRVVSQSDRITARITFATVIRFCWHQSGTIGFDVCISSL